MFSQGVGLFSLQGFLSFISDRADNIISHIQKYFFKCHADIPILLVLNFKTAQI